MAEGAFLSSLIDRLSTAALSGITSLWGVKEQVDSLIHELQAVECFLKDVDLREIRRRSTSNNWFWLHSLRDAAYDAEDLIESVELHEGRYYTLNPLLQPLNSYRFAKEINEIKSRFQSIIDSWAKNASMLRELRDISNSSISATVASAADSLWRRSSYNVGDDIVVGREDEVRIIVDRLLHFTSHREVVGIVGMGGIGKTTLASLVYNKVSAIQTGSTSLHPDSPQRTGSQSSLERYFDACAWVPVGQNAEAFGLLRITSIQIGAKLNMRDIAAAKNAMFQFLQHKRYLIVLDDIWTTETWFELSEVFPKNTNGSKILLTTRSKEIAVSADPSSLPYELNPLSEERSFQLFISKVFGLDHVDTTSCPPQLRDVGHQLSKKCGGLPLALVVLGGLLSGKEKLVIVWRSILKSMKWNDSEAGNQCLEILALSYNCLTYHMKLCFMYLGVFEEGTEISVSKLTRLWIGDDFIPQQDGKTKEETATDYLHELIQRCLVQPLQSAHRQCFKRVRIHGMLSELARLEARESRFFYCGRGDAIPRQERKYYRRLALHTKLDDFCELSNSEKLRSLIIFPGVVESRVVTVGHQAFRPFSNMFCQIFFLFHHWIPHNFLEHKTNMQYIRVLELEGQQILAHNLKSVQSNLNHLRYMSLRNTNLGEFPFPESNFPLLQTVDIRGTSINRLPVIFETLDSLRHIYLNWTVSLNISRLTNLQTLHGAVIHDTQAERDLMALTNLRKLHFKTSYGNVCRPEFSDGFDLDQLIAGLDVVNENPAIAESLIQMGNLNSIFIMMPFSSFRGITSDIIQAVTNHEQLQKLNLQGLARHLLLEDLHFSCIKSITLSGSWMASSPMESLGSLATLCELKLKDDALRCSVVSCSQNSFPELRYLKISRLGKLRVFDVGNGSFRNLTRFAIHECAEFCSTLEVMEHATRLQVLKIKAMPPVLPDVAGFCHSRNINLIS
ncbi:putative disease resistance RPP13-like protein 3 [Oryza brachyantha]|uniref:NB-ARC domain-containing protein n=1 Tax=Oryza brachyantha TaxID=4533 RepID=J3LS28_ORYBR|nr:putative disease resistance RPP13-like protein 3 [Oryza brachyantha]